MKLETFKNKKSKAMLHASRFRFQEAFSFIGVITAISVASMGLMGILSLASTSIKAAEAAQKRLIASGLAQEGLEIVRSIRRSNLEWTHWEWLATTTPLDVLIGEVREYCVQYDTTTLPDSVCSDSDEVLLFDSVSRFYQYVNGDDSGFYRKITMERISLDEIKVIVETKWRLRGRDQWHYLIAQDRLWNWK